MIVILTYSLSYPIRSYPVVTIRLFIYYLLSPTSLWIILATWYLIFNWPLIRTKIEVLSLAAEHVINPDELRFSIGLRLIGNHRSDPYVQTKLIDFIFGIIIASSSYLASFFTDVTGLVMYSI
jgi:hypothetical protein